MSVMKKIAIVLFLIVVSFITIPFAGFAGETGKVIKILAIGNSFSADAV